MSNSMKTGAYGLLLLSTIFSVYSLNGEFSSPFATITFDSYSRYGSHGDDDGGIYASKDQVRLSDDLEYDFYEKTCPSAQEIVRSSMSKIFNDHQDVSAALLRMLFHDCFIQGCDASVLLDDSYGNSSRRIERQAIPNQTLKGFDKIDRIKEELERACPGVVSCADLLVLATRDGIVLAGGPYYPALTGRKDSTQSYFNEATFEIPPPDGDIDESLRLFSVRGFNEREMVSLLGGHNIGKIGCEFIESRLHSNFKGTTRPDPTISPGFHNEIRLSCNISNNNGPPPSASIVSRKLGESSSKLGMTYYQGLSTSVSSGSGFDTHYYQSLLLGRGLLYADQQLMANQKTASFVSAYASDDGTTFRRDFARVMVKLSNLAPLTGSKGQVRLNCSASV